MYVPYVFGDNYPVDVLLTVNIAGVSTPNEEKAQAGINRSFSHFVSFAEATRLEHFVRTYAGKYSVNSQKDQMNIFESITLMVLHLSKRNM